MPHQLVTQLREARTGKQYHAILKRILEDTGAQILTDAKTIKANEGGLALIHLGALCAKHDLPFKAVVEYLETESFLSSGAYDRLISRGAKAREIIQAGAKWLQENPSLGTPPSGSSPEASE